MSNLWARRFGVATLASLAAHVAVVMLVLTIGTAPESPFEFQAPIDVELGLAEAVEEVAAAPAPPPPPAEELTGQGAGAGPGVGLDAGVPSDGGGRPDAGRRRRDGGTDAGVEDGGEPGEDGGSSSPVAFLPPGAQVALRIDMDRVRASDLRVDVERLIEAIPDWEAVLGGSGIDPVRDLSRVLIATPDFQRSHIVVAGRLAEGGPDPRAVVERMHGGQPFEWRQQGSIAIADWPSPDGAERQVAILDAQHFVLSRPSDLRRVLSIAAARVRDGAENPADALLSLGEDEALSIEVEGVPRFVPRSRCTLPSRLRLAMVDGENEVHLAGVATFVTPEESEDARTCLDGYRRAYASNPLVQFMGLDSPLHALTLEADETRLVAATTLRYVQLRLILGQARDALRSSRPPPIAPPPIAPPPIAPPPSAPIAPETTPPG